MSSFTVSIVLLSLVVVNVLATPKSECPTDAVATIGHKKSCTKYYLCLGGKPLEQHCANGLIYDHRSQKCNLERDAKCVLDLCPTEHLGLFQMVPHPEDCSKYHVCVRGQGTPYQCGRNLLFNQLTSMCDHAANVHCGPQTPPPPVVITNCPATGTKIIPFTNDCKKYYLCMEGFEAVFQCTGDLVFDSKLQQCNHAVLTTCPLPEAKN